MGRRKFFGFISAAVVAPLVLVKALMEKRWLGIDFDKHMPFRNWSFDYSPDDYSQMVETGPKDAGRFSSLVVDCDTRTVGFVAAVNDNETSERDS